MLKMNMMLQIKIIIIKHKKKLQLVPVALLVLKLTQRTDWSKEDQDTYQLEMNKLKGTEGKNYSFYAGNEGTINNTFSENWKDVAATNPNIAKFSPTLRFLVAGAKTLQQNATTDYGTGYYGGTDFTGGGSGMIRVVG